MKNIQLNELDWMTKDVLNSINEKNLFHYYENEELIGFYGYEFQNKTITILLYVYPKYRNKKIGKKLYHDLEKKFINLDYENIIVEFLKDDNSINFFKHLNFEIYYENIKMIYQKEKINIDTSKVEKYQDEYFNEVSDIATRAFHLVNKDNNLNSSAWAENERKWLNDNINCCYVIKESDKIIGFSFIKNNEIDKIFIDPNFQKKGYGKILASHAINTIIDNGNVSCYLYMLINNQSALKLYESVGFENIGNLTVMKKTVIK